MSETALIWTSWLGMMVFTCTALLGIVVRHQDWLAAVEIMAGIVWCSAAFIIIKRRRENSPPPSNKDRNDG